MQRRANSIKNKEPADAGIAIGPILFVVAILGILAAAIAAGSGSFTGSSQKESDKSKAAAIIEMGQNLKFGWDRITGNGIAPENVIIDPRATSNDTDLFSPSGGGITPPSNRFTTTNLRWCFSEATNNPVTAILPVDEDVCQEINRLTIGAAVAPLSGILFDSLMTCRYDDYALVFDTVTNPPAPVPPGTRSFCVTMDDGSGVDQGLFVQVLYLQ